MFRTATVNRIMRGHVMAPPFPLSNRAADVRPGCKIQRIALTLQQVADLVCACTKETEYFQTCIVGPVNCCLQCERSVSEGSHWRQQLTCPTILILKFSRQVSLIICGTRLASCFARQRSVELSVVT
ncbi:hypothetical protein PoB_003023600 [Plakobranchus ocellatus]|uniref:Uncharacterized protein n=1 Tax=Plakobranchus ocellatus TaxID=259542 RepID=A0AAV3ZXQ8_9GAST|nr:hypothetical protein PoB_003023600 [Plakobranchus ocellatus]